MNCGLFTNVEKYLFLSKCNKIQIGKNCALPPQSEFFSVLSQPKTIINKKNLELNPIVNPNISAKGGKGKL